MDADLETIGEVTGIFAGDGSLYQTNKGSYVLEVRGPKQELSYYIKHVKPKFEKVLSQKLKIIKRTYYGGYVIGIRACGKDVARVFHENFGFPIGAKSRIVNVPEIVLKNDLCWAPYIRGIFDTDGCIYLRRNNRGKYLQPVISIDSYSPEHVEGLRLILQNLGFNFWMEKTRVRMSGWENAKRFFKTINPKNPTQRVRYRKISCKQGSKTISTRL